MSRDPKATTPKAPPSVESKLATIMRLLAGCSDEERTRIMGALSSMYLGRGGTA